MGVKYNDKWAKKNKIVPFRTSSSYFAMPSNPSEKTAGIRDQQLYSYQVTPSPSVSLGLVIKAGYYTYVPFVHIRAYNPDVTDEEFRIRIDGYNLCYRTVPAGGEDYMEFSFAYPLRIKESITVISSSGNISFDIGIIYVWEPIVLQ